MKTKATMRSPTVARPVTRILASVFGSSGEGRCAPDACISRITFFTGGTAKNSERRKATNPKLNPIVTLRVHLVDMSQGPKSPLDSPA